MEGIQNIAAWNSENTVSNIIIGFENFRHINNPLHGKNSEIVIASQYIAVVRYGILCNFSTCK